MLPLKFSEYSSTFENINICLLWAEISSFSRQRFHRKWWPKISEIWWSLLAMRTSSDYSLDIRSIWTFNWKINSECFFSNCHSQDLSSLSPISHPNLILVSDFLSSCLTNIVLASIMYLEIGSIVKNKMCSLFSRSIYTFLWTSTTYQHIHGLEN